MSISTVTYVDYSTYFSTPQEYSEFVSTLSTNAGSQTLPPPSPVIITIEQLMTATTSLQAIETSNKHMLESFDRDVFMKNLQSWAGTGFQDSYVIYDLPILTSSLKQGKFNCSDGIDRDVWEYIAFCLRYPIITLVQTFQTRTSGMSFTFSVVTDPATSLKIHVSKIPS